MRLRLEADIQELRERGADLIAELARQLDEPCPELAKALQVSQPEVKRPIPQKALRDIQRKFLQGYHEAMHRAMDEIVTLVGQSRRNNDAA